MIRTPFTRSRRILVLLACLSLPTAPPVFADGAAVHASPENRLIAALDDMRRGAREAALANLEELIERQPNFRLAHYLQDELLTRRAERPFETALDHNAHDERHRVLIDEALLRWSHHLSAPPPGALPNVVLQLAPRIRHVVVVDLLRHRLYLWRNDDNNLKLVADFYASIGRAGVGKKREGDLRTPLGVYHVTGYKPDDELPELYGDGAFPVNYPNAIDRLHGRTGYGIWVHGVPRDTYSRPPLASEGCVVIANDDLQLLRRHLRPGLTPVVFTDELRWLSHEEAQGKRRELTAALQAWRSSREKRQTERHLAYYAADFTSAAGLNKAALAERLRAAHAEAGQMSLSLEEVSIYRYPGEGEAALISFLQRYDDGDYQTVSRKQQFWRRDPGFGWRIAFEAQEKGGGDQRESRVRAIR